MNFRRRSHWDDILFVTALVLPATMSTARYFESERQMTQIAQVRHETTEVVLGTRSPFIRDRARSQLASNANADKPASRED